MSLVLYAHPLSSYCWKVLIALHENDTPFTLRQLDFDNEEVGREFAELWPIAKMPILTDHGRTIVESSVIIEYLGLHHRGPANLVPHHADPDAALKVREMDRVFDNYVMMPMQNIVFDRIRPADSRDPFGVAGARTLLDKAYGWLEGELAGRTWAAGEDFSLADCAAAPSLHYAEKVHPFRDRLPVLAAYLDRLEARPSVARVLEEARPYAHMFPQEPAA
ncbi:glutathione S-transferase family protein [Sphingosinicella sp. LHD-64]|uniref:glutathione S-transferase family protein n=1 Tax=Sphingosinicella sp. LHD-64 TaxID=3072139 RepID=UPI00280E77CE|nr:glutathione S-transferase family protein [Sphingosinicella sp. LHD-64]MDQ8758094.1 glutathione S-transferase family protein [Sphingosinicella sp. LHD-64]